MIIFNSKAYPTHYATVDNVIIEIFYQGTIEEFFSKMERGEQLDDSVVVNTYRTNDADPNLVSYKVRPQDDAVRNYLFSSGFSFEGIEDACCVNHFAGSNPSRNDYSREVAQLALREFRADRSEQKADAESDPRLINFYNAIGVNASLFTTLPFDAELVKNHVKDALGILPDDNRVDLSIAERKRDSNIQDRLMWEFTGALKEFSPIYEMLSSSEELEFFKSLNVNEQRIVTDSLLHPHLACWVARIFKELYPDRPINKASFWLIENNITDSDTRRSPFTYESIVDTINLTYREPNQDQDIAKADEAFKKAYRRSPRILNEIIMAYKRLERLPRTTHLTDEDIEKMVKMFNLNSVSRVAKTHNINLLALALTYDLSLIEKSKLELLASYLTPYELRNGNTTVSTAGFGRGAETVSTYANLKEFCLWFKEQEGIAAKEKQKKNGIKNYLPNNQLLSVLSLFQRIEPAEFSSSLKAVEVETLVKNRRAILDRDNYERSYNYSFADNKVAIRGRDIIVRNGKYKMYMLKPDDLRNYTVGYDTQCCQHWNGAGNSCVWKLTTDPFAAVVVIEDIKDGAVLGQSFVWTDEMKDTFVFDNIEFRNEAGQGQAANLYKDLIAKYVSVLPYDNVHMGTGYTEGVYRGWGKALVAAKAASMPKTVEDPDTYTRVYTDYHAPGHGSVARIFKDKGNTQIPGGAGIVEKDKNFIPTEYDQFLGKDNYLKYFLFQNDLTLQQKIEKAEQLKNNPSDELIDEMVRYNPQILSTGLFNHIPENTQAWLVQDHIDLCEFVPDPSAPTQRAFLERYPDKVNVLISKTNADPQIIDDCLRRDGRLLDQLPAEALTYERALIAVESNGTAIEFVPEQFLTDEIMTLAVQSNPSVISWLPTASDDIKAIAVRADPNVIALIDSPSDDLQTIAAQLYPASMLGLLEKGIQPCLAAVHTAINGNYRLLRNFIKDPRIGEETIRAVAEEHEVFINSVLSTRTLESVGMA